MENTSNEGNAKRSHSAIVDQLMTSLLHSLFESGMKADPRSIALSFLEHARDIVPKEDHAELETSTEAVLLFYLRLREQELR